MHLLLSCVFLVSFSWLTEKIIEFRCRFRYPRWWHSNNHPSLSRNYHFTRQLLTNSHATSTTIVMTREKKNTIFLPFMTVPVFYQWTRGFFPWWNVRCVLRMNQKSNEWMNQTEVCSLKWWCFVGSPGASRIRYFQGFFKLFFLLFNFKG